MHALGASNSTAVLSLSILLDVPKETSLKMFIAALFTLGKKGKTRNYVKKKNRLRNTKFKQDSTLSSMY